MTENYRKKYKKYYGIEFSRDYDIHHIDMSRNNNSIENLVLLPKRLHEEYHTLFNSAKCFNRTPSTVESPYILLNFAVKPTNLFGLYMCNVDSLLNVAEECCKWYDYKMYLDGKMPNIHKIELEV